MKKRWLIAAALVAGTACAETTQKDISRDMSGKVSTPTPKASQQSALGPEQSPEDNPEGDTISEECGATKEGNAP